MFLILAMLTDAQVVLAYLDKRIATGVASSRGEEWAPLHMYR